MNEEVKEPSKIKKMAVFNDYDDEDEENFEDLKLRSR